MPVRSFSPKWKQSGSLSIVVVLLCTLLTFSFVETSYAAGNRQSVPPTNQSVLTIEQAILSNIQQNGFDNNSSINNGLGGLWVNWLYGSSTPQTNLHGNGVPDGPGVNPPRHDELTDLRYLHDLWLYKAQYPNDHTYDSEIQRYTPIVQSEFAGTTNERGWLFDEEFMDLYRLSQDSTYQNIALGLVQSYSHAVDPKVGSIYKTSPQHPLGFYPVDHVLEAGCALIQAGTLFNNPQWVQQGQSVVNFVYAHAYIPQYHTFAEQMDRVLTSSRSVNPVETFYVDNYKNYVFQGNTMRVSALSQIIISLLHTYQVTHNASFLLKGIDLLSPVLATPNTLHLWDATNLGYYYSVTFNGQTPQQPGSITVNTTKKLSGTQVTMLWAFHLANTLTNNAYQSMENLMIQVAIKAYYAPGHGVLDEVKPDWTPRTIGGQPLTWVTSEAMTAELEALLIAVPPTTQPSSGLA